MQSPERLAGNQIDDLAWAVNSPSLLDDAPWVERIDPAEIDVDHLVAFLNEKSDHRVGRYFERLILYWLQYVRRVEIVCQSEQIREGNRTVGEIDFIFRDLPGPLTHWETAVKFFLYDPQSDASQSQFIGPNAADNFQKKTEKILGSQLSLSKEHFPEVQTRQAFVKGRIFYQPDQPQLSSLPKHMNPDHQTGTWIRATQMDWIERSEKSLFRIQRKPLWLTAANAVIDDPDSLSSTELVSQLRAHFADSGHPVLISEHDHNEEPKWIFVVPDHWPDQLN